jgi:hypothetical protein
MRSGSRFSLQVLARTLIATVAAGFSLQSLTRGRDKEFNYGFTEVVRNELVWNVGFLKDNLYFSKGSVY